MMEVMLPKDGKSYQTGKVTQRVLDDNSRDTFSRSIYSLSDEASSTTHTQCRGRGDLTFFFFVKRQQTTDATTPTDRGGLPMI